MTAETFLVVLHYGTEVAQFRHRFDAEDYMAQVGPGCSITTTSRPAHNELTVGAGT